MRVSRPAASIGRSATSTTSGGPICRRAGDMARSNRSTGKPIPAVDRFASLSAFLQSHGIRSQPTLELPYLDWLKLHHLLEKEIDQELHVGGRIDALVTRGIWFHCCGVKI